MNGNVAIMPSESQIKEQAREIARKVLGESAMFLSMSLADQQSIYHSRVGEEVDKEDAEVKRHILEAKINMAKEHRAALREVLLMGVTRLIVDKGEIEASVDFTVKANRESTAHHDDQNINVTSANTSFGGGIDDIVGGPSGSFEMTNTNIQVNTSDKKATDDLSATLHGKVNIQFKTDYFKLDRFADM